MENQNQSVLMKFERPLPPGSVGKWSRFFRIERQLNETIINLRINGFSAFSRVFGQPLWTTRPCFKSVVVFKISYPKYRTFYYFENEKVANKSSRRNKGVTKAITPLHGFGETLTALFQRQQTSQLSSETACGETILFLKPCACWKSKNVNEPVTGKTQTQKRRVCHWPSFRRLSNSNHTSSCTQRNLSVMNQMSLFAVCQTQTTIECSFW